jgi:phage gp29-like protein
MHTTAALRDDLSTFTLPDKLGDIAPHQQALQAMTMPPALARARFGGTAQPWNVIDGSSYRPGYALTPGKLWAIYRAAELGNPALQCDTFEDLVENDGHMRGQYESRLSAVAFRPWIIQPGGTDEKSVAAAAALWLALRRCNMMAALWHMMDALGYGYSGINIAWRYNVEDATIEPSRFLCAPHRRFIVNESGNGELRFITEKDSAMGVELQRGEWLMSLRPHRKTVRAGLFRTCGWWSLFKRMSITDWIVFAEKFGIPLVLGQYSEKASPESRAALLQAVTDIGNDGAAVLADTTKIVINEGATRFGDVGNLHPAVAARCDAEISKVITGATLNVESGGPGSFALGRVHEARADALSFADAFWLQALFTEQVAQPFVEYNPKFKGAQPPLIYIRVQPEMPPDVRAKVYQVLQLMGAKLDEAQIQEEFGLREPSSGVGLKPIYAPPPEPTAPAPKSPVSE